MSKYLRVPRLFVSFLFLGANAVFIKRLWTQTFVNTSHFVLFLQTVVIFNYSGLSSPQRSTDQIVRSSRNVFAEAIKELVKLVLWFPFLSSDNFCSVHLIK